MQRIHRANPSLATWFLSLLLAGFFFLLPTATPVKAAPMVDAATPSAIGDPLTGIQSIDSGNEHTCAVTDAGTVQCWGRNGSGELGDGSISDSALPLLVPDLDNIAAVSAGDNHTCALTDGGGVKCWGSNSAGQLGNGTTDDSFIPVDVSGLGSGVIEIAAGGSHTCALTDSGGVKCWGSNDSVQLGDSTSENRSSPVDVSGLDSGVTAITTANDHTCALTSAGGVKCWGYNFYGQLGDSSEIGRSQPADVTGLTSGVAGISAGFGHTCALMNDGAVKCWGRNAEEQLGDGTETNRNTPVDVPGAASNVASVHAGGFHTCIVTTGNGVKCWGWNEDGQLGNGTTTDSSSPVNVNGLGSGVSAISLGDEFSCALIGDGVQCWGINDNGELGNGSDEASSVPVDVVQGGASLTRVGKVSAGALHSCAVADSGAVCWGFNEEGQIGDGSVLTRSYAVEVVGLGAGMSDISAGKEHSCGLTNSGGVKCWGRNGSGELGNATFTSSLTPVDVSSLSSGVVAVSAGGGHSCALTTDGGVKCWGSNSSGELGDATRTRRNTPVDVFGLTSGVSAMDVGESHSCAVSNGGVKCWGWNFYGQLGEGTTDSSSLPKDVSGLGSGVAAVSAGRWHTCALTTGGGVKCWGFNVYGQLGNGSTDDSGTPVDVDGLSSGVAAISAGDRHTCALTTDGAVKCWGFNSGRLGDGTNFSKDTPVDVIGLDTGVASVSVGGEHTCVVMDDGKVLCWGDNENAQIGDGSTVDNASPTRVIGEATDPVVNPTEPTETLYLPNVQRGN